MTDKTKETYKEEFYDASEGIVKSTRDWVDQFSNVPQSIFEEIIENGQKEWYNILQPLFTTKCKALKEECECSHIEDYKEEDISLYENYEEMFGECQDAYKQDETHNAGCDPGIERNNEDSVPMWSTLFQPSYRDIDWFRDMAQTIYEEVGALVYENEHYEILIGMNSAGHCFYQSYWVPLYKLRGLKWHE